MASERKTSGAVVIFAWVIVIVPALFALHYGQEWSIQGHLRLCAPLDSVEWPAGHYKPPINLADLSKPDYWCVRQAQRAQAALSGGATDQDIYGGLDQFWGDDVISVFFANVGALFMRWFSDLVDPIFNNQFIPGWNSYFAGNDPQSASHRAVAINFVKALLVIFAGVAAKITFDWLQEIVLLRKSAEKSGA